MRWPDGAPVSLRFDPGNGKPTTFRRHDKNTAKMAVIASPVGRIANFSDHRARTRSKNLNDLCP
jgi:hypothetical protein